MRQIAILILLLLTIHSYGQKKNKLSLLLQVQPELTFHKNDYAFRWSEKKTVATFNAGINASLQYKLTKHLFADVGIGFISRRLKTKVFVDQSLLPPPYYDSTLLLYTTKSVSFRTLEFPLGIGYSFLKKGNTNLFVKGLFVPNFILNIKYETNDYPAFKKNIWQGYSLNLGLGLDRTLNKKISLTTLLDYSIKNTVARDDYTFSQDDRRIALTHAYLQLNVGVKVNL